MTLTLEFGAMRSAVMVPPPSKSDAHRALVLAWCAGRELPVLAGDAPRDMQVLQRGLGALGQGAVIPCDDAGAPFRFMLALAAMEPGWRVTFTGTPRLGERPRAALLDALQRDVGAVVELGDPWPVVVTGGSSPARLVTVDARESSQFASAVLLGAARRVARDGRPYTVVLDGEVASRGYLDMTLRWMRLCGWDVEEQGHNVVVNGMTPGRTWPGIPADWSSTAYLLLLAWASGGAVELTRESFDWPHPDRAVLDVMRNAGLNTSMSTDGARVTGALGGHLDFDVRVAPDLAPTVAALACALSGTSTLRHVGILRAKESDRVAGIMALAQACGVRSALNDDVITLTGPAASTGAVVMDCAGDHRRAMSAATLGALLRRNVVLQGNHGVEKSFPGFFEQLRRVGVDVRQS